MEVAEALVASGGVLILRPPGENVGVQLMNLGQGWVASRMTALALRLVRFPNFNRLRNYAEFDIQLAAMCARGSVSLEQMEQAFPRRRFHIRRFAVAALAAGYVVAQPATSGVALSHGSSAKRGFFRALLEKLF